MSDILKIQHAYNAGDLISVMAGLQKIYQDTGKKSAIFQRLDLKSYYYDGQISSTVDKDGNSVCMNEQMFYMLKPLVESQEYVDSFNIWQGETVDWNYELTRDSKSIPMPAGTVHSWYEAVFPQTSTDLSRRWIEVDGDSIAYKRYYSRVLINRTQRYHNPYITYYFLKQYEKSLLFSGTETEYQNFCSTWNLEIEHLKVDHFYQLAQIMTWCKFGIYNQSMAFHIADAQKTPRVLELCSAFPNTFITGANGYQFYRQAALEFYIDKLINQ